MTAVDTNVLIRLLTGDDARQAAAAKALFAADPIWIGKTVLLETFWVLRSLYGIEERVIRDAFVKVLSLKNVRSEDEPCVATALELVTHGVDFADALHLNSRPPDAAFVSFDRSFVLRARKAGATNVSGLPSKDQH